MITKIFRMKLKLDGGGGIALQVEIHSGAVADTLPSIGGEATVSVKKHCLFLLFSNRRSLFYPILRGGGLIAPSRASKYPSLQWRRFSD